MGTDLPDDAAVFLVNPELAVVQTVDFLTPMVDDPYLFGQIAAANALSDSWAMGVDPAFALNIVAFPVKTLHLEHLVRILQGGADKCAEAGVAILGGHSIDDPEPKYGLSVTALAHPDEIITKSTARPGDLLILTKPLGAGVIAAAIKQGCAPEDVIKEAVEIMLALNGSAAAAMRSAGGVTACTDVTGFGLLGHLREMAANSGTGAHIHLERVPVIEAAWGLARQGVISGGTRKNLSFLDQYVDWNENVTAEARLILCDAITSGGLLISVRPDHADRLIRALKEVNAPAAAVIGGITDGPAGRISVTHNDKQPSTDE